MYVKTQVSVFTAYEVVVPVEVPESTTLHDVIIVINTCLRYTVSRIIKTLLFTWH